MFISFHIKSVVNYSTVKGLVTCSESSHLTSA